jgi:hypothetical protein
MELSNDWRGFQKFFSPRQRQTAIQLSENTGPIFVVEENGTAIMLYSDHEDLSEWVATPLDRIRERFSHRKIRVLARKDFHQWMEKSLSEDNFFHQLGAIKEEVFQAASGKEFHPHFKQGHFLLRALNGWWSKILPSSYGVFIRLEGQKTEDFFFVMKRGRLEIFHAPDLSRLGRERRADMEQVVRYLSEKHLVKVQGVTAQAEDWVRWSTDPHPWSEVAKAFKKNRAAIVPFRWSYVTLIATKGYFGI